MAEKTDVLAPTRVLAGKYRLGRLIGEGGMGAVYEAEHTGLGSKVAVKLLTDRFAADEDAQKRFRREARAAAAVRHDNVVRVTDTGTSDDGIPFIVMEVLEGESLNAILKRSRSLDPKVAVAVASEVLDGLAAAHARGVIHRDLKPGNIFLAEEPDGRHRVKILDFGISKFYEGAASLEITMEGAVVGTPQYMPPEQVSSERDLDARADVYAVGVLLYRMLTGKLPFSGDSPQALYEQILNGAPKPPTAHVSDLNPRLEAAILKAMALDRENRFSSAKAFKRALREALPDIPPHIPTLTPAPLHPADPSHPRQAATVAARPRAGQRTPSIPETLSHAQADTTWRHRGRPLLPWALVVLPVLALVAFAYVIFRPDASAAPAAQSEQAGGTEGEVVEPPPVGETFHVGITGYNPEQMIERGMDGLLQHLQKALGRPTELVIVDAYEKQLATRLVEGELDLVAFSPVLYVRAKKQYPAIQLLVTPTRAGGPTYHGLILARADSKIEALEDFRGKRFCYVTPKSTSGYLYPRALFRKAGINLDDGFFASTNFANTHLHALKYLYGGYCDGAAVYAGMLREEATKHEMPPEAFYEVASTPRIPYDAYCVAPSQDPKLTARIKSALLELVPGSPSATETFRVGGDIGGFIEGDDRAYDPVREIEAFVDE